MSWLNSCVAAFASSVCMPLIDLAEELAHRVEIVLRDVDRVDRLGVRERLVLADLEHARSADDGDASRAMNGHSRGDSIGTALAADRRACAWSSASSIAAIHERRALLDAELAERERARESIGEAVKPVERDGARATRKLSERSATRRDDEDLKHRERDANAARSARQSRPSCEGRARPRSPRDHPASALAAHKMARRVRSRRSAWRAGRSIASRPPEIGVPVLALLSAASKVIRSSWLSCAHPSQVTFGSTLGAEP